jgi:hypothetical protein
MKFPIAGVIHAVKHSPGREQTAQSQGNRLRTLVDGFGDFKEEAGEEEEERVCILIDRQIRQP